VGKVPSLNGSGGWASRHQLLLPLSFSFILYYSFNIISDALNLKQIARNIVLISFAALFVLFQVKEGVAYNVDYLYQQSIMENFKHSKVINENSTFIVKNNLRDRLAKYRRLRLYELNGLSGRYLKKMISYL